MTRITRIEVIDETGRSYVNWKDDNDITTSYQDDGKTLKVFVNTVKPKSPVEEAYKEVYGHYPLIDENDCCRWEGKIWFAFQKGYNASQKPEKEQQIKELVRESVKWCEEHQNESLEDYLTPQEPEDNEWTIEKLQEKNWYVDAKTNLKSNWEPKPHTPEQIEKSLRTAFGKAQQTEKWKEIQKLIDEEDNDKNFKNSLDLIKEWGEKNKPPTLYEILMEWWINHLDMEQSDEEIIDGLVDIIDKKFIPPSNDRNGYEWEKCLKMMRDKLR